MESEGHKSIPTRLVNTCTAWVVNSEAYLFSFYVIGECFACWILLFLQMAIAIVRQENVSEP